MSRFKVLAAALAVTLGGSGTAAAGPMLTGAVTYDRSTQLYTYSYTLDDRSAPGPVDVIDVRVATHVYDVFHLNPVGHTAPAPFAEFYTAQGGWDTPEFAGGTFYEWNAGRALPGLTPGVHSGLSFTSRYGPGTGDVANYALFSRAMNPGGTQVEVGRVFAPDLTNTPEPGTLALVAAGLTVVGLRGMRRGGRVSQPTGQ
jgi:PEP-CTERM motif-containing protein